MEWLCLPKSSSILLLHPPERDLALKHYCSEQLKINTDNGGMKGKRWLSVPGHSLVCCPGLGQGNQPSSLLPTCSDVQRGVWCKIPPQSTADRPWDATGFSEGTCVPGVCESFPLWRGRRGLCWGQCGGVQRPWLWSGRTRSFPLAAATAAPSGVRVGAVGGAAVSRWLQLGSPGSRCGFRDAAFAERCQF